MKRICSIWLVFFGAVTVAGCGENGPKAARAAEPEAVDTAPPAAPHEQPAPEPAPESPPEDDQGPEPATAPAGPPPPEYSRDATLRLNQVQMKGTHNSYHVRPEKWTSSAWEYDMPALGDQAGKWGVRAFELDVHWSNERFEVYHWRPEDPGTKCPLLTDCIDRLREWSSAHPGHLPLFVFLDLKYDETGDTVFNHLDDLEWLVTDRWPREKAYTPDDFKGEYANLKTALHARGWPPLAQVRGKVIFVMMAVQEVLERYAHDDTGLNGRRMFPATGDTGWPHGAVVYYDDVLKDAGLVRGAVDLGYIVRTRGDDIPTLGDDYPARFQAALASGAHLVMTDYPIPGTLAGHDTSLPGGTPARCNPRTAPPECEPERLENPGRLGLPYP